MKPVKSIVIILLAGFVLASCNKVSYKKTKSGLLYRIYPGNGKDSLIKSGQYVKFQMIAKLEDSVLYNSYGKLPGYAQISPVDQPTYNLLEILKMMRKGDSAVTVQMVDTLIKQGAQLPPTAKKGGRVTTAFRIVEVFNSDSVARADYDKEMARDRPRQMQEEKEQMAKMQAERKLQQEKEFQELKKSGEIDRELKEIENHLSSKKITAQKTGSGVYVQVKQQGTGPQAENGKYVLVKYTGKYLDTDSTFQSNSYPFQLGKGEVIKGWDEGLLMLRQGGKGTLFIPGFLAYGRNPPQGSSFKPFQALKFDVELLSVSDTAIARPPMQ